MKRTSLVIAAVALGFAWMKQAQAGAPPPPAAPALIFEANHLASAKTPSNIYYAYRYETSEPEKYGKAIQDSIKLHVETGTEAGTKKAVLEMYTGDRKRDPIPFDNRSANPVILMFLEDDVWHMQRRAGQTPTFYKARITLGIRRRASVDAAKATVGGREVEATRISVKPFANDPETESLGVSAKIYELLLSDAVPGGVVELKAITPKDDGSGTLTEETLTFDREESAQ